MMICNGTMALPMINGSRETKAEFIVYTCDFAAHTIA
jgi:hypothetical protein